MANRPSCGRTLADIEPVFGDQLPEDCKLIKPRDGDEFKGAIRNCCLKSLKTLGPPIGYLATNMVRNDKAIRRVKADQPHLVNSQEVEQDTGIYQ